VSAEHAAPLGYGLVGAGLFGRFCLEQYRSISDLRLVAVADVNAAACAELGALFGIRTVSDPAALLALSDVDIVHIATPPFTHSDLVLAALAAGKHVLCEKPLATGPAAARALAEAAREAGRVLAVNLIMRYNPVCALVKQIIDERLLGEPLHGYFENYAKDEPLPPEHWFWQREKSGGIFVEHSVHFFDLFEWWLGEGRVVAAQAADRPGTELEEHVRCTVMHGNVMVDLYHGFHQTARMDRQELRLVFERGDLRLEEWVPTRLCVDAIVDDATIERLRGLIPNAREQVLARYEGSERECIGRHKRWEADARVRIAGDPGMPKMELYAHVLKGLMQDQLAAIRDPSHERRITERNGVRSVEVAAEARRLAGISRKSEVGNRK